MRKGKTCSGPNPYNWDVKITSALRRIWRFSPQRTAALVAARTAENPKEVRCAKCGCSTNVKLAAVDHRTPVVPLSGFDSWDAFIQRLQSTELDVLCEACHSTKTKAENAQRALHRKTARAAAAADKKARGKK